jgi:putative flippase GtrA
VIRQFKSRQFLVFLLTGGTAAAVNFGSRIVYNQWLDFSSAVIVAYITGMITAFILARLFVFKKTQQPLHRSVIFFILVNLVAVLQTWVISMGLAYYFLPSMGITLFAREIAHAAGVAVPVFTSYIGHKRWSFKEGSAKETLAPSSHARRKECVTPAFPVKNKIRFLGGVITAVILVFVSAAAE